MEMTSTQRLILANQYELMALLNPEQAAYYRRLKTIVQSGFAKELQELDKGFSYLTEAECKMVRDTLEMYHALQVSYNNLQDPSAVSAHQIKFVGYCAVREKKYCQYVKFLRETEKLYTDVVFYTEDSDAQVCMAEKYQKMLAMWRACPHEYHLSVEEIRKILNA
ncbi:YfbU family protein [Gallibacterium trehalosifermentans]|uniref:YfbU family protein n=1 Tax=Gallibacterium trehalosifermentans TaxID=516935 RepID=A0ABV6H349_9PAST